MQGKTLTNTIHFCLNSDVSLDYLESERSIQVWCFLISWWINLLELFHMYFVAVKNHHSRS